MGIMRKAILALLVISAVTLLASADKPSSVIELSSTEPKPVKSVTKDKNVTKVVKVGKSVAKTPKEPNASPRQQKKYPRNQSQEDIQSIQVNSKAQDCTV